MMCAGIFIPPPEKGVQIYIFTHKLAMNNNPTKARLLVNFLELFASYTENHLPSLRYYVIQVLHTGKLGVQILEHPPQTDMKRKHGKDCQRRTCILDGNHYLD